MFLSCAYFFSQSPSSSSEPHSSSPLACNHPTSPSASLRSPPPSEPGLGSDVSLLSTIAHSSSSLLSSLNSILDSSLLSRWKDELTNQSNNLETYIQTAYSRLPASGVASLFTSASPDPNAPVQRQQTQASTRSSRPATDRNDFQGPAADTERRTTFTFVLFGAASTAAVYLLVRNRRAMNRLQTAKSLAYKDARAWRRVALDFARINALATSRVQNLVASSLGNGKVGHDIGRQIERELQEAARAVAQRRNCIREQDSNHAEPAAHSRSHSFEQAWSDFFHAKRPDFGFGPRNARHPHDRHSVRHDDVSEQPVDRVRAQMSEVSTISALKKAASSHQCEVVPLKVSRAASNGSRIQKLADEADNDLNAEPREEWTGDVDLAMREHGLELALGPHRGSDPDAVDALSCYDTEARPPAKEEVAAEEDEGLLPVSDLSIATNGRLRDEPEHAPASTHPLHRIQKTRLEPTRVKTTVTGSAGYSYPISDKLRDAEDIFMAAWDDSFGGLSQASLDTDASGQEALAKPRADPNRALFDKLRSQRAPGKSKPKLTNSEITDLILESMSRAHDSAPEPTHAEQPAVAGLSVQALMQRLESKEAELAGQKRTVRELSERLDTLREMCHDLTDEAQKRDKTHRIQIEQLEQKLGLFTVWAEEMQRRLGLETPPFFASLRKPLERG